MPRSNPLDRRQLIGGLALSAGFAAGFPAHAKATTAPVDVLIVGAGLSGLNAALLLQEQGVKTMILEGDTRVGGRIHTLAELGEDAGGSQIGPMYARARDLAQRLNVGLYKPGGQMPPQIALRIRDTLMGVPQWRTSPANLTSPAEHAIPPMALMASYIKDNPLKELSDWEDPAHLPLDIPMRDYLAAKGASPEALRLMQVPDHADSLAGMSALHELRKDLIRRKETGGVTEFVTGGASKLPEAMRAAFKGDVVLGAKVASIETTRTGVIARTADGRTFHAKRLLLTVPFSVAREIVFHPKLPAKQAEAIRSLPYSQASFVFFDIEKPYWDDGFAPSMWTDSPLEMLFTIPTESGEARRLLGFVNGQGALDIIKVPPAERLAYAQKTLETVRPATVGKVKAVAFHSWTEAPLSRGAYFYAAPGQIGRFGTQMWKPVGRVHFAGEHTARLSSGIEAALESGERAALELVEAL